MDGRYYAYATQTGGMNAQVMTSTDLADWTHLGDALPELPPWAVPGRTWSPSVLARDDGCVLYVALRHEVSGRQCISFATSRGPEGPFVDNSSVPALCPFDRGGCIDPSPFVDADGTAYLIWKTDDDALGRPACLWGAQLSPDGRSLREPYVQLLRQTRGWELPRIEAPCVTRSGDDFYLFYSGGSWESPDYATGYARSDAVLGRYRKATRWRPWMSSRRGAGGPGGAEVFVDAQGGLRIAYHAWDPSRIGYAIGGVRSLWIDRLTFVRGRPVLGGEARGDQALPA